VDPTDWKTVYAVNHVGFAMRENMITRERTYITPTPETTTNFNDFFDPDYDETPNRYTIDPGEHWFFNERPDRPLLPAQFRFNWSTPLVLSPNHPRTLYFGANYLFKSDDRGDTWKIISPDLTTNDPKLRNTSKGGGLTNSNTGGENHFTIITISESPLNDQMVWAGTDDGNVQLTKDGGNSWTNLKPNIDGVPEKIWVSRVEASHFKEGTAYVSFDNHRFDDNKPYVFRTRDYGQTWQDITGDLPEKYSVYVVREDYLNPDLLFVGTEEGVYTSVSGGSTWHRMKTGMPTVAVHDLVIHPRDGDLIAGTHGRSLYIMDDISPLRQLSEEVYNKPLHIFNNKVATNWHTFTTGRTQTVFEFRGKNPVHGAIINFYVAGAGVDLVTVNIIDEQSGREWAMEVAVDEGINRTHWGYRLNYSAREISDYKHHLQEVITVLSSRVKRKDLKSKLKPIRKQLARSERVDELNEVRHLLVKDFNGYAGGQAFFGKKLMPLIAPAGEYKVIISASEAHAEGLIKLRNDPLDK
jgi:hypothetical protein